MAMPRFVPLAAMSLAMLLALSLTLLLSAPSMALAQAAVQVDPATSAVSAVAGPPASLTVVLDDNYPPYAFRDHAGRLKGALVDEWALWEQRTGIKVHLLGMDWARAQVEIQMGRANVIDTLFKTPSRADIYDFGPPHTDIEVPIHFHQSIAGIHDAASLKGFTIGVKEGDSCIEFLQQEGLESFRRYPNYEAVVDAAAVGEVRVFCVDQQPATYFLQRKQLEKFFLHSEPLFKGQFHRAVRKGDAATLQLVQDGFARISKAERQEIQEHWLGSPVAGPGWIDGYWRYGAWGLVVVGGIAILLATWNVALRRRVQKHTHELTASMLQLREAKQRAEVTAGHLDAMLEAIPDLLFEVDIDGRFMDYRAARQDLLLLPPEQFLGHSVNEVMPPEAAEQITLALHEAASKGTSAGTQMRLEMPGGERWYELSIARKREGRAGRDHFIVLSRDITDRKHAEQALARHGSEMEKIVQERSRQLLEARGASDRASRAKSEFLSRMSHELRTPMNAILGFSQLIEMDPSTTQKGRQFVDEILRAGQHLLHLINDVLDLEQVESGRLILQPESIGVHALMAEAVALMQPLADKQGVVLHMPSSAGGQGGRLAVRADAVRVKQIVLNLLSNAVKYNRRGGQVWLDAVATGERTVRISVRDSGIGIAERHLPRLFQPFNRLGAEAGAIEGTGIGLSLCRSLVELMQGHIEVESREGEGSTFCVDLPRADTSSQEDAAGTSALGAMNGSAVDADGGLYTEPVKRAIVLYVEDNPANLELMSQIVARHHGVTLISSPAGRLGFELARAHRPDLILLDIHLPDIDGYTLLGQMRDDPATRGTPVIAVTANAMPMDVQRIQEAGFDDHVAKPIQVTQMDLLIHERLGSTLNS
jgi:two-component system sensor histidine kinase/response regulator